MNSATVFKYKTFELYKILVFVSFNDVSYHDALEE